MTTFADGVFQYGGAPVGGSFPFTRVKAVFVDGTNGSDGNNGTTRPFATIQKAVDVIQDQYNSRGIIFIAENADGYDEAVTIDRAEGSSIILFGNGGRGSVFIAPSTTNATALTNHTDDVTLVNVGCDGDGTGNGLTNTGSRFRAYGSKFETDTGAAIQMTLGTVAQEAAGTRGRGADCLFEDCETAWATDGVLLTCTDYGAVTQVYFRRCKHANHTNYFNESVGSGGSAAVLFRNLEISDGVFDDPEDGTAPTAFILLNDDNGNTGIVTRNSFPSAINSGKNLVSTALHWVSNYHTGGISTGQPS